MNVGSIKTNEAIKKHLEDNTGLISHRKYYGPMFGHKYGWFSSIGTTDRDFFEAIYFDENCVYIEISPCITCGQPYLGALREYLSMLSVINKVSNIRVEDNGYLYVHLASFFDENGISSETIKTMEGVAISTINEHVEEIQMISAGRFPSNLKMPSQDLMEKISKMLSDVEEGMSEEPARKTIEDNPGKTIDKLLQELSGTPGFSDEDYEYVDEDYDYSDEDFDSNYEEYDDPSDELNSLKDDNTGDPVAETVVENDESDDES